MKQENRDAISCAAMAAGIVAMLFSLGQCATARADTIDSAAENACRSIDLDPSVYGVQRTVNALKSVYGNENEKQIMAYAMQQVCPWYMPLAGKAALDYTTDHIQYPFLLPSRGDDSTLGRGKY